MAWKVIWSDEAIFDLGAIVRYISADNPSAAEALAREMFEGTRMLAEFRSPGAGSPKNMMQRFERLSSSLTGSFMK
jgi:plasmid stabilization system protein ParE